MKILEPKRMAAALLAAAGYFSLGESYGFYDRAAPSAAPAPSRAAVQDLSVTSGNLFFRPQNATVKKGQPVKITFRNTGIHTFTIDALGVDIALRESTVVAEFTPSQSGTFEYYCKVPGHRERGMTGALSVEG